MHPLTSIPLERMHRFGKSLRTYIYIYVYRGVWGPSLAENLDSGLHISVRGSGGPFAGVRRSIAWDSPVGRPVEARLQIAVHVHKFNIGPGPRPGL